MYNTGNPLGSNSPKDFSDNTEIVDQYVNDVANISVKDRFGVERKTIHGIEVGVFNRVNDALKNLGYFVPIPYSAGLSVESPNFTVIKDGVIYASQPGSVPFTTGEWDESQWYPIQNTANSHAVLGFQTETDANVSAATMPDNQPIVVQGASQGIVENGRYVKRGGTPAVTFKDYEELQAYSGPDSVFEVTGIGIGGQFVVDSSDSSSQANGGTIFVLQDGRRVKRIYDGAVYASWFFGDSVVLLDHTKAINSALEASTYQVNLGAGVFTISENLNIGGKRLVGSGKHKTILNCISPTSNGRFGGVTSNQAAVYSLGTVGSVVNGSSVEGLTINCNGLLNTTGSVGLKGVMFRKSHGCFAKNVLVIDSPSYAFWCSDDVTGTDYASAVFEDCEDVGSEIGFEAVNVTTCSFVRCRSEKPVKTPLWPVYNMFHAYGLNDSALVIFEDCYGRGYASTVIELLLKCRNVRFSGGYFEQLNTSSGAFAFSHSQADFASIEFAGAVFKSAGFGGVLSIGDNAPSGRKGAKFIGGSITASNGVGVEIQANNSVFEFVGTDISSTVTGGGAAICLVTSGVGNSVQYTGGSLKAYGGAGTAVAFALSLKVSDQTIQVPASGSLPIVRQLAFGTGKLISDGTYSYLNAMLPQSSTEGKVVVSAIIDASSAADGAAAAALAVPISFIRIDNDTYRFFAPASAAGRSVVWKIEEFE